MGPTDLLVPVKVVPLGAPVVAIDRSGAWVQPSEWRLDPLNEVTIEWAVRTCLAGAADSVTAVCVGGDGAEAALRIALARGADSVLRIDAGDVVQPSVGTTALLLAAAARRTGAKVVAFGYESYDGSSGVVPSATAAALRRPLVSRARDARIEGGELVAACSSASGRERVSAPLPAVVSFVEGAVLPRNPRLASVMATRAARVPVVSAGELLEGREAAGWASALVGLEPAPVRERATQVLDPDAGVAALAQLVAERGSR